jgi:hypothetical protein
MPTIRTSAESLDITLDSVFIVKQIAGTGIAARNQE